MPGTEPFKRNLQKYESWFLDNRFAYVSELKAVQALLPKAGEGVEIGVGTGRFAAPLKIRLGVEQSAEMAEIARKRGVEVHVVDSETLPFSGNSFDFALMVTTLCLFHDPMAALREAFRVLKPKGCLLIGEVDRNSPVGKDYRNRQKESRIYQEAGFYSTAEILALMTTAGFGEFALTQTLFCRPDKIEEVEPVKIGHGEGAFVVVRGCKMLPVP